MLPELFWLESLISFELFLCSKSTHFVMFQLFWKAFFVRVVVFSISISMYLSHADDVPITDHRTKCQFIRVCSAKTWGLFR